LNLKSKIVFFEKQIKQSMKSLPIIIALIIVSVIAKSQITEIGLASFYADKFDGRITASGAIFDQNKMTAAHRTLPFGSKVKVININNRKSVIVEINDRGPFVKDRVIDLSKAAATKLGFINNGVAQVKVEVISLGESKTKFSSNSDKSDTKTIAVTPKEKTNEGTSKSHTIATDDLKNHSESEYYKVQSEIIEPQGFGIQIASYQEGANLMRQINDIKKSVKKDIIIKVGDSNGKKVYRVIVGSFASRDQATEYNKKLTKIYKGSFVVSF